MSVISVCLSPGLQRSVTLDALTLGEVNRLKSVVVDIAGKGVNVCRVLQRLGADSICLSQGGDNGAEIIERAAREGLNLRLIPSSGQLRTCTSIIEMAVDGGRRVTELVEPTAPVEASCVEALTETVLGLLPGATALVIAGSMAPGFPAGYQARLAALARSAGVPVFVDLQGPSLREVVAEKPAFVKINLSEFAATFLEERFSGGEHRGVLAESVPSPELKAAVAAVSRLHATTFVLTRGANSILVARQGDLRVIPVSPLAIDETLSTIGSGDAFLAGLLFKLLTADGRSLRADVSMDDLESAIDFATACAQSNAKTLRPGFLEATFTAS